MLRGHRSADRPGEFVAIVGRSGCGKSTLLRLIAGLDRADAGTVWLDGARVRPASRPHTRIMFQDARLLPWQRVLDNVGARACDGRELARARRGAGAGRPGRPGRRLAGACSRAASASAWRWPARWCSEPRLLLLDEPLGALDALTRIEMQRLIESDLGRRAGFTALLVTHDVRRGGGAGRPRGRACEDGRIALDVTRRAAPAAAASRSGRRGLEAEILGRLQTTA